MMRNVCLACVGAAALFATGCRMTDPFDRQPPAAFTEADRLSKAGKFGLARDAFADFAASPEAGDFKWEALYWAGRNALELGETLEAEARFDEVLRARPYRRLRVLALAGLGAVAYSRVPPDYHKAKGLYADAVRSMGLLSDADRERVEPDKILFLLGMCHWNLKEWERGDACFDRVMDEYADGDFAKEAKRHNTRVVGLPLQAYFYAEVATYAARADAARRAKELAGQKAYVEPVKHERETRYSVRIGRYDTRGEAEAKCKELRASGIKAVAKP